MPCSKWIPRYAQRSWALIDHCAQQLRRPLAQADFSVAPQEPYTRTAANEIRNLFPRLPNPDLVLYVYPHKPYVIFEVIHIKPTGHLDHEPSLQLSLSLLQEPGQPDTLLIALAGEHQR